MCNVTKQDTLALILERESLHLVFHVETKLIPSVIIPQYKTYNVYRKDRETACGGVMIMVRKELLSAPVENEDLEDIEAVACQIYMYKTEPFSLHATVVPKNLPQNTVKGSGYS